LEEFLETPNYRAIFQVQADTIPINLPLMIDLLLFGLDSLIYPTGIS